MAAAVRGPQAEAEPAVGCGGWGEPAALALDTPAVCGGHSGNMEGMEPEHLDYLQTVSRTWAC